MPADSDVRVVDSPEHNRFEILVAGGVAGFAAYERRGDRVVFTHTEIDDAHEGQGFGSALARGALDTVRDRGEKAVPSCPFMAGYIDRHDEYADLVDHEFLARVDRD